MKLRLFTAAMLQVFGLYMETEAVRLRSEPITMPEAESESMTEAENQAEMEAQDFMKCCV